MPDGDKAMWKAISKKFPQAKHRLCCWHLGRNAQAHVNKEFTSDFHRCMLRPYTEERFEEKWKEIVLHHSVESNEWVVKMYSEKTMWAEAYLRGHFFGGMRSTQRSERMNAYLNHYVSIRMRLIAFVKQMDRLMDRQREVEGKDNFDSAEGQPVLITHMKPYKGAAADVYTRAMFRLVREQILQKGMLIVVQVTNDEFSRVFRVKKWKVSNKEWRVHVQGTWTTVSCTCLMMETLGVPCSHLFAIMKVDNLEAIPSCLILSRWTVDVTLHNPVAVVSRHGLVHQVNRELLTCSCRLWQLSGIPCPHACRCIGAWGDNVDAHVHKLLSVHEYRSAYGPGMNMLPEITQCECQSYDHVLPPMTRYSTCTCFEQSNHHSEITPYNYSFPMRFTSIKDCLIFYITQ